MANENFGNFADGGFPDSGEWMVGANAGLTNEERWTVGSSFISPHFAQTFAASLQDQAKDNLGVKFWHSFEVLDPSTTWTAATHISLSIPFKCRLLEAKIYADTASTGTAEAMVQVAGTDVLN